MPRLGKRAPHSHSRLCSITPMDVTREQRRTEAERTCGDDSARTRLSETARADDPLPAPFKPPPARRIRSPGR